MGQATLFPFPPYRCALTAPEEDRVWRWTHRLNEPLDKPPKRELQTSQMKDISLVATYLHTLDAPVQDVVRASVDRGHREQGNLS